MLKVINITHRNSLIINHEEPAYKIAEPVNLYRVIDIQKGLWVLRKVGKLTVDGQFQPIEQETFLTIDNNHNWTIESVVVENLK